jgi:hypothetical protein
MGRFSFGCGLELMTITLVSTSKGNINITINNKKLLSENLY